MRKAIFIGGSGRSGTTILGKMIAKHPDVYNFVETRFLVDSGGLKKIFYSKDSKRVLKNKMMYSLSEIIKNCPDLKPVYKKSEVLKLFNNDDDFKTIIFKFFENGLKYANKNVMLNKTPHNVKYVDLLHSIFGNFKFIHIFRNPYDVYASVKPLFWGPSSSVHFIKWYNKTMIHANAARKNIPKDKYLIIKMEDLVLKPRPNIEKISKFIGLKLGEESIKLIDKPTAHMKRYEHELSANEIEDIRRNCMISYEKWMRLYKKQEEK